MIKLPALQPPTIRHQPSMLPIPPEWNDVAEESRAACTAYTTSNWAIMPAL